MSVTDEQLGEMGYACMIEYGLAVMKLIRAARVNLSEMIQTQKDK